ncbi:hypothetical protein B0H10DRAFT_697846 [Mycena sp. CBHHK59/15]|nr:hypothetical protein B0H10DRAFT_697846 [Mycena sp. CBHHK59/15]
MQDIVNLVFKPKEGEPGPVYVVTDDGPWWGLIQYHSNDWRNAFPTQADKGMKLLHTTEQSGDESDEDEDEPEQDPAAPGDSNEDTPTSTKPHAFKFDTLAARADFVEWALQQHENGTMVFYWQQWGDGKDKKGFFLSYLIVYAYAYHLSILDSIPIRYGRSKARPYGALLLAVQAVECNLQRWRTGTYTVQRGPPGEFSAENLGDIKTRTSKTKNTVTRRATKFLSVVQKWDDARWEELRAAAAEWVDKRKARAASSSRGTSEAEDMEDTEDEEPEIIVLSD